MPFALRLKPSILGKCVGGGAPQDAEDLKGAEATGCSMGGETSHPGGKIRRHRKQTIQSLQEAPETDEIH